MLRIRKEQPAACSCNNDMQQETNKKTFSISPNLARKKMHLLFAMRKRRFRSEKKSVVIKKKKINEDVMFKESVSIGQTLLMPISKKLPILAETD